MEPRQIVGNLYSDEVTFGDLTATQIVGSANDTSPLENSGIAGFSGQRFNQFPASSNATPFFQSLCNKKKSPNADSAWHCRMMVLEHKSWESWILLCTLAISS